MFEMPHTNSFITEVANKEIHVEFRYGDLNEDSDGNKHVPIEVTHLIFVNESDKDIDEAEFLATNRDEIHKWIRHSIAAKKNN